MTSNLNNNLTSKLTCNLTRMAKESADFYDTIIVGAGFGGASTAYHLLCENNYKGKVLILEARDRIGGRAYGEVIAGKHVELGCNWIHGLINNPVSI